MSSYTFEFNQTSLHRARITVASDEGEDEAKEAFWAAYWNGTLDIEEIDATGPHAIKWYRG